MLQRLNIYCWVSVGASICRWVKIVNACFVAVIKLVATDSHNHIRISYGSYLIIVVKNDRFFISGACCRESLVFAYDIFSIRFNQRIIFGAVFECKFIVGYYFFKISEQTGNNFFNMLINQFIRRSRIARSIVYNIAQQINGRVIVCF